MSLSAMTMTPWRARGRRFSIVVAAEVANAVLVTVKRLARDRGRTVLLVTHHLRAVLGADQILVFDGGRLVQAGRHAELVAIEGLYRRLWQTRSGRARQGHRRVRT